MVWWSLCWLNRYIGFGWYRVGGSIIGKNQIASSIKQKNTNDNSLMPFKNYSIYYSTFLHSSNFSLNIQICSSYHKTKVLFVCSGRSLCFTNHLRRVSLSILSTNDSGWAQYANQWVLFFSTFWAVVKYAAHINTNIIADVKISEKKRFSIFILTQSKDFLNST